MKRLMTLLGTLALCASVAATELHQEDKTMHRYMIERTFPKGALDAVDADAKAQVARNNAIHGVKWVMSYTNPDKTKTFCVYEGVSEQAIRDAAKANNMSADKISEIPGTLLPD